MAASIGREMKIIVLLELRTINSAWRKALQRIQEQRKLTNNPFVRDAKCHDFNLVKEGSRAGGWETTNVFVDLICT